MAKIIKYKGEDYIKAKDMHEWVKAQAGIQGLLITYKMFLGLIKNTDQIHIPKNKKLNRVI